MTDFFFGLLIIALGVFTLLGAHSVEGKVLKILAFLGGLTIVLIGIVLTVYEMWGINMFTLFN